MKEIFMKIASWLAGSADNRAGGASSKKLSAFWALVILATITQFTWLTWAFRNNNWEHFEYVITTDFIFAATGLGINSFEKIKGKDGSNPTNTSA
jgi:hypothetical protein